MSYTNTVAILSLKKTKGKSVSLVKYKKQIKYQKAPWYHIVDIAPSVHGNREG